MVKLTQSNNISKHNTRYINGKCTPKQHYVALYEMKDSGQTLFIDDAGSLVGSKGGNEHCAGLLKEALDGDDTDGKGSEIAWRTQVKILDDDGLEIPKHFYYRGNIVIATNFLLGNIETAIRIKCYTQEMVFSTKEIIEYIRENILDKITTTRGGEISKTIKLQVIDYFHELAETSGIIECENIPNVL